ncbi:MAG: beta-galactosidase trimerization domain-containing protein, partial [Kiritimatiellota bacterium]|nr:beta-galactosidase trimerization domain-containing protein [Kiritimatiellota bacterium]
GSMNPALRWYLWWRLFDGNYGGSFFGLNGLFRPDLTYGPCAAEAAPIIREFKAGAAKLLKNCERVSEIGVHYSHESIRGASICGEAALFRDNREGWIQALEDAGYQCEFLSTAQIEAGELAKRNYAAFVLPYSIALSEKEVAALRSYVKQGGLLLADGKTGLMDLHCKTLSKGRLDDLFGISRPEVNPMAPSREGHVLFSRDEALCKLKGLEFDVSTAEPNLTQAGGASLGTHGQTPMAVTRKTGKGTAVFLNMFLDSFAKRRKLKIEAPMRGLVENLLRLHGIAPAVVVASGEDAGYRSYTVQYRSGDALYVGSVGSIEGKDPNASANVSITFPKEGFVYDLRNGTALGRTREAKKALLAGDALLYAVMPYQVTGVNVKADPEKTSPGQPVKYSVALKTSAGDAGMHVINIEIIDPDGKKLEHYGASLLARNGKVEGGFVTALNDKPGRWTIRATDYVTRVVGECNINLEP